MGAKPSEIYLKAGFEDYTSFYRSFKKFFGFPPSNALQHGFTAEKF
jgi:AraC-like DNA-binding protein